MNTSLNKLPYVDLADYYDLLINDEEGQQRYLMFVEEQLTLAQVFSSSSSSSSSSASIPYEEKSNVHVLELACGSGMLARMMAHQGYVIDATDVSEDMIGVAKLRWEEDIDASGVGDNKPTFFALDMRSFSLGKKYDVVLCFCDSINYLSSLEDIFSMFQSVHDHLQEDGVFLFDCHSWDRLAEFKDGYEEADVLGDLEYRWNIDTVGEEIHQTLLVWDDSFYPMRNVHETHIQRVYRCEDIVAMLEKVGFEEIVVMTDFEKPGVQAGEKQFYRCRRNV